MRLFIAFLLAAPAALLAPRGGHAQGTAHEVEVGTLLRVPAVACTPHLGEKWAEGRLVDVDDGTLHIMNPPRQWICAAGLVSRVQVATNQSGEGYGLEESAVEGVLIGGAIGGVIGTLGGLYFAEHYHGANCSTEACSTEGFSVVDRMYLVFGWAGAVAGMFVGSAVERSRWWDDVPVPDAWTRDPRDAAVANPRTPGPILETRGDGVQVGLRVSLPLQ